MTIPQEAIEAAVNAYGYTNAFGPERETQMTAALTAARPHVEAELRKQIAEEIGEAQAQKMRENPFNPFATDPIATGYIAGLHEAARIAEGKQ